MTDPEKQIAVALGACSFSPGSWDKRFCRAMATKATKEPESELSERQRDNLLRMAHKYRRQLPEDVRRAARAESDAAVGPRGETVRRVLVGVAA